MKQSRVFQGNSLRIPSCTRPAKPWGASVPLKNAKVLRKMESQEKTKKWADEWKVGMKKKWASMKKHAQNKKYTCPDNKRKNKERKQKILPEN